ncbi:MAG TPA: hypothetical protein VFS21_21345, partial [Roseiflexaceae bacterium]|nr:hypothetical protein [Roseiflexaceae bacterium]
VGGSYIFVHHLVLEHFAKDEPGTETNLLENINSFPLFYRSHLFTRFEGLDPRQPLTVGNWTPLIIWVGPFDDPRGGENRKPFQFVFPTDVDYAEFIVAVKVDNPGWDVRAAEPILIVEKPGRTSQEAVFTIIARHASTATLYITITQRGTGVVVQHLWLEVSAALMTDLSKKLVGTTPSPETFDQHDTEGTSDLPPFSAGPQQSSFTGSISPKQTHHKEASEPQSTRIHKLAAYIKRRICHTSKQSYFAEKQAEENSPGSIYTNVPDQHHSPQTVLFPLDSSGSTRRDITITLQPSGYDSSSYTAYVQATFPDRSLVRDYQLALRIEELQRLTARLRSAMNQVAVFDEPNNPSPFRNITITDDVARRSVVPLADAGQLVWRQLFDRADNPELQALGQRLRSLPDGTSVQFVLKSSEFVLPWAVLYDGPGPVTPENLNWRAFWGYRYQIDTLLQGSYPSPTIERTAPELYALLNNGDLLSHSETQASHITQNLPQIRAQVLWGDDACAFLSRGPVSGDMVYCFCHGDDKSIRPQSDQLPSEAVLRFGARAKIRLADINVESCSQPLVFLNACETAALQPFHRDGFAPFFLQRWGARGFVGNEIKVPQTLGHDFALHFWELFVSGVPVGKILWQLRRYYVETHCNALAFTYSLYGHGDTCLRTGSVDNKHG